MIKNFIFDFGNVLTRYDMRAYADKLAKNSEGGKIILENSFGAAEWKKYDAGLINENELLESITPRVPEKYRKALKELVCTFENAFEQYDEMVPVLEKLKQKGFNTFLLSNFPAVKYEQVAKKCPILDLIDNKVVSYKIKLIKPNSDIYEYLLKTYSLDRNECLFADDYIKCVEGAKQCGIHAHLFTTADNYISHLKDIGIF